jgi:hypothetical protein
MNRAPGPNDFWWKQHAETCDGNKLSKIFESKFNYLRNFCESQGAGKAVKIIENQQQQKVRIIGIKRGRQIED